MSEDIWRYEDGTGHSLDLTRFIGPASDPDRLRWQLTTGPDGYVTLTRQVLLNLAVQMLHEAQP